MENDDTHIIAISLGIPSATLISIVLILAIRFRYRLLQRVEAPHTTPTVTTTPTNPDDDIPLEQQPPRIFAPIPQRLIPIDHFTREQERGEILSEETSPVILERRPPTPPRRRTPIIVLSPTTSPDSPPYVPQTPSRNTHTRFAEFIRGFDVGFDIRPITPTTSHDPWADRNTATAPSAPISPNEFWDNVTIPYSAYFPSDCGSLSHNPPSEHVHEWDQPVQNQEYTLEPVQAVQEPVTSSSTAHLYPPRYAVYCPPQATTWEQLAR